MAMGGAFVPEMAACIAKCQVRSMCSDAFKAWDAEEEGTDGFANGDVTLGLRSS